MEISMRKSGSILGVMAFSLAVGACGGDGGGGPVPAGPWSLDRTMLEAGRGNEFCERAMTDVAEFLSQYEGEMPPSDRYGGIATVGSIGEIADGMNGLVSADYTASQHQSFVNMMTLIEYDAELNPVPYLAESWEVNEDNTELIFRIRDDVYWHDGELTDAYDVAFTYEVANNPETGFPNTTFWTYYEGIEVVDSFTVKLRMRPHAEFLDPWRTVTIMPEHLLGDVPVTELKQHPFGTVCPVGNGPFVFVQHRQDASWTFQANPAFPEGLGGRPFVDRYTYRSLPEQNTLLTELLTGNLDVFINPKPDQAQRITESETADLRSFPFRNYVFVAWNSRRPQLSDKRVRQAITVGTNRQEIVDVLLQGYGTVANGSVPPFHWAYDPEVGAEAMPYDPDRARRLLEEAGWTDRDGDGIRENSDGLRLAISIKYNSGNDIRKDVAEIMQAQLRGVGIEVTPTVVEWATLLEHINTPSRREFDGVVMSWIVEFKLDDTDLFHSRKMNEAYGYAGTSRPEIDRLLDELQLVVDRDQAREMWREYQELLIDEQPYTFFYFSDRLEGINKRLQDVVMDVRGEWLNIRDWWIPAERRRVR
jgi:peptide/nickel transport system substrate-binding protein